LFLIPREVRGSSGIEMDYGLDGRGSFPGRVKEFSLVHSVKTGSVAHPVSYPMGIRGSFPGVEAAGA
jgi:hypothetical protein